jgi:molybdate transport system substrate-binding protein
MRRWRLFQGLLSALLALALIGAGGARAEPLVVFAAASLKTAMEGCARAYAAKGAPELRLSYGGSLTLARQIVAGAPADIFASADEDSMDEAAKGGAIDAASRFDYLRNQIVIVAPVDSILTELPLTPDAIGRALGDGRLSTGEVNTVPVGRYAKAALVKLGLWSTIEPRLAMSDNVRAALEFVARGEAPLGIVYATDAAAEKRVKIVASFPEDSHPPILYPFARVAASRNAAAGAFLAWLREPEARAIFEAQGFVVAP